MGRNRVIIDENHCILYGYDGPCNSLGEITFTESELADAIKGIS